MSTTYHFIAASEAFLTEEEPLEEVLRERTRHYQDAGKAIDFWLVRSPAFLESSELAAASTAVPRPAAAVVSTDETFITFLKLRLEFVQRGSFEAPSAAIEYKNLDEIVNSFGVYDHGFEFFYVFTGEADWCEGVRLHSPGGVLEHRIAPQAARLAPRAPEVPRWTPPAPAAARTAAARRPLDIFGMALDGAAALLVLAGVSLLPMALPANAAEARPALQAEAHADCQHFRYG